jgi:hypothetical protein
MSEMSKTFVPLGFEPPMSLAEDGFRLEPLGPEHNERDHAAWMSSIEHIRATPGFEDTTWPTPMSLADNLGDLERHAQDFRERSGFTYSVLDGEEVVGCVYIYPSKSDGDDAKVQSWVRESRADLDIPLWRAVSGWLERDWPFEHPAYAPRT